MFTRLWVLLGLVASGVALAHTGQGEVSGFWHGLAHPFSGLDHWVAMLAVGLWSAQMALRTNNKALLWRYPAAFMGMMAVSAFAAVQGYMLNGVEDGIVLSLIVLGILLASAYPLMQALGLPLVGILAVFHGQAHGNELPHSASALTYAAGFLLATGFFHALGAGLGMAVGWASLKMRSVQTAQWLLRAAGVAIVGVGLALGFA